MLQNVNPTDAETVADAVWDGGSNPPMPVTDDRTIAGGTLAVANALHVAVLAIEALVESVRDTTTELRAMRELMASMQDDGDETMDEPGFLVAPPAGGET